MRVYGNTHERHWGARTCGQTKAIYSWASLSFPLSLVKHKPVLKSIIGLCELPVYFCDLGFCSNVNRCLNKRSITRVCTKYMVLVSRLLPDYRKIQIWAPCGPLHGTTPCRPCGPGALCHSPWEPSPRTWSPKVRGRVRKPTSLHRPRWRLWRRV